MSPRPIFETILFEKKSELPEGVHERSNWPDRSSIGLVKPFEIDIWFSEIQTEDLSSDTFTDSKRFLISKIVDEPHNPNDELSRLPPALHAGVVDVGWTDPSRALSCQRHEFKER